METTHASPPDAQNSRWLQSSSPSTATWLSLNYGENTPSHDRRYALPFSTLSYLHFVSLLTTRLAAQTQTTFSMLQIKTIHKNTFRLSASYFFILSLLPYKLSEETTQRKHTHIRYNLSSLTITIIPPTRGSIAFKEFSNQDQNR